MAITKAASVYGVNENGEIVAVGGTGSTNVTGFLSVAELPVDGSGKMVVAGLPSISADANGTVSLAGATGGAFLVIGGAAPVNSDGRVDGTVYIQNGTVGGAVGIYAKSGGVYKAMSAGGAATVGAAFAPLINGPTTVGVPVTYSGSDTATSQQWTLDGASVAGATGATYTQSFADAAKALRVRASSGSNTVTTLPVLPGVQNLKLSNTVNLRAMLAGGGGLILGSGDSLMAGFETGGGLGNNSELNMRPNSYLAKLVAGLNGIGIPASKDSSFGTGNYRNNTPALFAAMDPRWSFTGTSQNVLSGYPTYGGALLGINYTSPTDLTKFTPGGTFDTITVYYAGSPNGGSISVSVDGGATVIDTTVLNVATAAVIKKVISCPAGSSVVTFKYGGAGGGDGAHAGYICGVETSTSGVANIRIINGALSGTTVALNAAPVGTGNQAYVPRAVMGLLAGTTTKGILMLNGWYNDQGGGRTLAQIKAAYDVLCTEAQSRGWDIWYSGYPAFDPATMTQAVYDTFEQPVAAYLRDTYNAIIFQASKVVTDFTTYNAQGYYGDALHLSGTGAQKVADSLLSVCKLAAAGAIPA